MKRLLPRALVVLTVLVVLGVGGYAGQVWWAIEIAKTTNSEGIVSQIFGLSYMEILLSRWQKAPWCGTWDSTFNRWIPRRSHYEQAKLITGLDLGNDPSAWEAWFKAHPNLVWDAKQKRLVEPKP